jgi:hypothetical protein
VFRVPVVGRANLPGACLEPLGVASTLCRYPACPLLHWPRRAQGACLGGEQVQPDRSIAHDTLLQGRRQGNTVRSLRVPFRHRRCHARGSRVHAGQKRRLVGGLAVVPCRGPDLRQARRGKAIILCTIIPSLVHSLAQATQLEETSLALSGCLVLKRISTRRLFWDNPCRTALVCLFRPPRRMWP